MIKRRLTTFSWLYDFFKFSIEKMPSYCLHLGRWLSQHPILFPWGVIADFSHSSRKLTMGASHFTKIPHTDLPVLSTIWGKLRNLPACQRDSRDGWVLFPKLGKICHGKEFNQEGFHQGQLVQLRHSLNNPIFLIWCQKGVTRHSDCWLQCITVTYMRWKFYIRNRPRPKPYHWLSLLS